MQSGEEQDMLKKENIKKMPLDLATIRDVLQVAFKQLDKIKDADVVLVIGNTGSGKSTMLSSLLKGPDALESKIIEFMIDIPQKDGTKVQKPKTKTVIDNKQVTQGKDFIIGNSEVMSETFMPHFIYDEVHNIFYGDIAGLQDTAGPLFDFINSFMVKRIF